MKPRRVDTKTRYQSVFARHQLHCALGVGGKRCNCTPTYFGVVWDREGARHRKTGHLPRAIAARDARADLREALRKGELPRAGVEMPLGDAYDKFVQAARDGVALNKWRRRYRPRSVEDLSQCVPTSPTAWPGANPTASSAATCRLWSTS